MKKINLIILVLFISISSFGQYKATSCGLTSYLELEVNDMNGISLCNSYNGIFTRNQNDQILNYIDTILGEIGLYRNFSILGCSEIQNAFATHLTNTVNGAQYRFIVYDDILLDMIKDATHSNWGTFAILAHELGHHLNGHIIYGSGSQPDLELQADEFAGFVLAKVNGDLQAAKNAFLTIMDDVGSSTHPPVSQRLIALERGWQRGMNGFNDNGVQVPQNAEQLLIANIKAVGGDKNIKKIKYIHQVKNVNYVSYQSKESDFSAKQQLTFYRPSSYYLYTDQGDRTGEAVYMGHRIFRPDNSGEWKEDDIFGMRTLSEQASNVSYVEEYAMLVNNPPMMFGKKTINGKTYFAIELPEEKAINYRFNKTKTTQKTRYYDTKTFLLAMVVEKTNDSHFGDSLSTTYYSNYKSVGGVLFPFKTETVWESNNARTAYSVTEFENIYTDISKLPDNFVQFMKDLEFRTGF